VAALLGAAAGVEGCAAGAAATAGGELGDLAVPLAGWVVLAHPAEAATAASSRLMVIIRAVIMTPL
jgi:hypothetical protein